MLVGVGGVAVADGLQPLEGLLVVDSRVGVVYGVYVCETHRRGV